MRRPKTTSRITPVVFYLASLLLLASCASIPSLDPEIGKAGLPLSEIAKKADVKRYELELEIFPKSKSITGVSHTEFSILQNTDQVELKLDSRFKVSSVEVDEQTAQFTRVGGVLTIDLGKEQAQGDLVTVSVGYSGKPHVALNAPWTGGFVWSETPEGLPWIANAQQGEGCDLYWPCKDHFSDKADEMRITLTVPRELSAVTNGVLQSVKDIGNDKRQFDWLLSVPAIDYTIALNIGPFTRIQRTYTGINGTDIPLEFWALTKNSDKAEKLVDEDLMQQIKFFEENLGPYPWGTQKLGYVETPHLGMEHQTINAYGNNYKRNKEGYDWLLQHELAHEWFSNLATHQKIEDAWIHEGFAEYMQPAYALEKFGEAAYHFEMYNQYLELKTCKPVVPKIGPSENDSEKTDVFANADIYYKGSWMLHTLRWLIGDDLFWQATRELLYGTANTHTLSYPIAPRYRSTDDFVQIVNRISGKDYQWLFDVYLKQAALPQLKEERSGTQLDLAWVTPENLPFAMPVPVSINGEVKVYQLGAEGVSINVSPQDKVIIDPKMKVLRYLPIIGKCEENEEDAEKT